MAALIGLAALFGPTLTTKLELFKFSNSVNEISCGSFESPGKNEFVLFLDKNAYSKFHQPVGLKKISIWKLDFASNRWSEVQESDSREFLYKDPYIEITPGLKLKLLSTQRDVFELREMKANDVLCNNPINGTNVYVKLLLTKKALTLNKTSEFRNDTFVLCDNEYILAINIPVSQKSVTESNPDLLATTQFDNNTNNNLLYRFNNVQSPTLAQNTSRLT